MSLLISKVLNFIKIKGSKAFWNLKKALGSCLDLQIYERPPFRYALRHQASCRDGRLLSFSTADEFDSLVTFIENTDEKNRPIQGLAEMHGGPGRPAFKEDMDEQNNHDEWDLPTNQRTGQPNR